MKKTFLFLIMVQAFLVYGQENLVPNPSFEKLNGKPKKIGELDKASPWRSPTAGTAEIFWSGSRSEDISTPQNKLGYQVAKTGDNYAGAIFYDKKNENMREYLQVELKEELDSAEVYCVEFFLNISDLSKYSFDLIGAYLSVSPVASAAKLDTIGVTPQIVNKAGRSISDQAEWKIICGAYQATGGEKFLTIGNFFTDKQIKLERRRKPRGMAGSQNEYGYYFIDDVSIIKEDENYECDCYKKMQGSNVPVMNIVYSKVSGENEETLQPEDLIESKIIYYEPGKSDFTPTALADIKIIIKVMAENENFILDIVGYADETELTTDSSLAEQRAQKVLEYMAKNGIKKERMIGTTGAVIKTSDDMDPERSRKVDFSVTID